MASVEEMEAYCRSWLNQRRGKLRLQRSLYMVTGLSDEASGCWYSIGGIANSWGPTVFSNWHSADLQRDHGTNRWDTATVRIISFPWPYPTGQSFVSFKDFGAIVRAAIHEHYPEKGSTMGEYDVVSHSMGGLDAFSALLELDMNGPAADRIANAFNLATMDTPWRGVPNIEIRKKFSNAAQLSQCDAIAPNSPELGEVDARADELKTRVTRLTCYGVDTAVQVEVASANLYSDKSRFSSARAKTDYRFLVIPGSSHSGALGITTSVITIANLFDTLTRGDRLSMYA